MLKGQLRYTMQCLAALAALTLTLLAAIPASAQDFEGKTISQVQIRYSGPRTVDEARIRNYMSVRAGEKYDATKLDDDIRSLYESGLIDNILFFAEPQGEKVKVIAEVVTRPALAGVGFTGNEIFSDKKLAKVSKLKPGGPLSDTQILEARNNIEKQYHGYGFPDVIVSHRMQPVNDSGRADLIFIIDEGAKNKVHKITFEGNNSYDNNTLRKEMKTKQQSWLSFLTKAGQIDTTLLDEDVDRVLDFYRNRGYLRAKSDGFRREPAKDDMVNLVMAIQEGPRYKVNGVGFGKTSVFKAEDLMKVLTLNAGNAYSAEKMRRDITTIRSYYGSRGYADATVTPDLRDAGPSQVNITYRITEGKPVKVGRVTIEGNDKTQDRVIRRELPLKPGDNFNTVEVETARARLRNMNYFNDVQVSNDPSSQKGYRDINILVDEKETGQISFGLGFSSVDSIVGYINLEQTNFDITNPWGFTGAGQRFSTKIQIGSERTDFDLSLVEPWFLGRRLALGTTLFYHDSRYFSDVYEQSNFGGEVFLRHKVTERSSLKTSIRIEKFDVQVESDTPDDSQFWLDDGDYLRNSLNIEWTLDTRDSNQLTRKGHRVRLGAYYAGLGGDVENYGLSIRGEKYWNLYGDSILELRGAIETVESDDRVPVFDRKFLGGQRNLRGFEYRDVGPRDEATGEVLGGSGSAFIQVEYTIPLIDSVRAAIFYDAGLVSSDAYSFDGDVFSDVGLGLRLRLPFGPLAVDYAIPVQSPDSEADKGGQFNFYLDYNF
ncbi:outer membrane protein assembly factor BamA [Persicirhabdus sediminis]|uniref:Outer membrane protein assembly factor BamA n=1 Tax=Persicirhabdus sediminis TaxID=454144 RepID=A0A8J7MEF5_9BACT|nr:outer membrane protein assembly factor BamA [Persicirhabdus sediminis]MBK1790324.1 outer membrane protein assembly factor BamA [Persicirhabdus sediminis]